MGCINCQSEGEPKHNAAGEVVGCKECFSTMREWCEVGHHWVHEGDARTRYHAPRSKYDEGCVECEGD